MQEVITADLDWLRSLKDNKKGYAHNERIDRITAVLERKPTAKFTPGDNDLVEGVAEMVYSAMVWVVENPIAGNPPTWVPRGNSHAQTEARRVATQVFNCLTNILSYYGQQPTVESARRELDADVRRTFIKDVKSVLKASGGNHEMAAECVANLAAQIDRQALAVQEEPKAAVEKIVTFNNREHPLRIALQEALVNSPALRNLATREQVSLFKSDIVTDLLAVWRTEDDYISLLITLEDKGIPIPERMRPSQGGGPIQTRTVTAAAPVEAGKPVCEAPTDDTLLHVEIGKLVLVQLETLRGSGMQAEVMKYDTLNQIVTRAKSRVSAAKVEAAMVANLEHELKVDKRKPWRDVLMNLNSDILTFVRETEDAKYYGGQTMLPKFLGSHERAVDVSTAIADMFTEFAGLKSKLEESSQYVGYAEEPGMLAQEPKYRFSGGRVYNRASGEMIPLDEPVFMFRARDSYAALALKGYAAALQVYASGNEAHIAAVDKRIMAFELFAVKHPGKMKVPDTETVRPKDPAKYTCKARADNNGVCPLPNVHCAYPACEERV